MDSPSKFYKSIGTIEYRNSWVVLVVSPSIQEYYYHLVKKHTGLVKLNKPYHDTHVTVVAGKYEDCTQNPLWKKHHNTQIEFAYDSFVKDKDMYFWLEVVSDDLVNVRRELGLTDIPKFPFHITIANLKNCGTDKN